MTEYSIEARSFDILGVASHNFLVLRDEKGKAIAELHGLATDRETKKQMPIGYDEDKHSLRVWHFALDPEYAERMGVRPSKSGLLLDGQDHVTVLKADKQEIMARWNAAVVAKGQLNALDLDYPSGGFKSPSGTVNSNAAYRTLSEIMGVSVRDFKWKVEPGLDYRMVDPKTIETLRTHDYPVLKHPAIKEGDQYIRSDAKKQSKLLDDQGESLAMTDARIPGHPRYGDYTRIREGLACSIQDSERLDNVAASTYRETVSNPCVRQVDYAGVHNGFAVAAYAPHGLGREPMFNAYTPVAPAERESADVNMSQAHSLTVAQTEAQLQAQTQQQSNPDNGGPTLSIGSRNG